MVMVVGPLKTKAEAKAAAKNQAKHQDPVEDDSEQEQPKIKNERRTRKNAERLPTEKKDATPLSNSMADYLPDELKNL